MVRISIHSMSVCEACDVGVLNWILIPVITARTIVGRRSLAPSFETSRGMNVGEQVEEVQTHTSLFRTVLRTSPN